MAEANPNLPEVLEIIERVERQDPSINTLIAAQQIVNLGFLLIGTAESQAIHVPTVQTYYEKDFMQDFSFGDDAARPVLQATWAGNLAIESAIFGDWNIKDQRRLLGYPLTTQHHMYGWATAKQRLESLDSDLPTSKEDEAKFSLHAERPLLQAVKRLGNSLKGSIDIIDDDQNEFLIPVTPMEDDDGTRFYTVDRPGIAICHKPVKTIATLSVSGPDLWLTNISSDEYDKKAN